MSEKESTVTMARRTPLTGSCEAGIGVERHNGVPMAVFCRQPGTLRKEFFEPYGVILCNDCYEKKKEKHGHTAA